MQIRLRASSSLFATALLRASSSRRLLLREREDHIRGGTRLTLVAADGTTLVIDVVAETYVP